MKTISVRNMIGRSWMLLVVVVVATVSGFAVYRLQGIFGSDSGASPTTGVSNEIVPFNPKHVTLEVFGAAGAVATINYLDGDSEPREIRDAALPWAYTITTTQPAVFANVVAQGDGDVIGCRITVNGVVKDERTVNNVNAYTFCMDKSS
ncbi:MmpS family protein [Mycolicibacterium austroafricanum]|nr:MmpS family transport accessory protein [Mycolicibacterium austroafricanum]QZT60313.1 MmpS family protein [Mycolicibacterium austroafricanum]